jgi:hypothetical protein
MNTEAARLASLTDDELISEAHADYVARKLEADARWAAISEHLTAAKRLAALRDRITLDRGIYDGYAQDYDERGDYSHASRYQGRAAQCDALLAAMDEMEAGR